jgi:ABC-type transport system involved in multi-copper enzyme maturation permease subunit
MLKVLRLEFLFSRRQLFIVLAIFTAYFAYMAARIDSPRVFVVTTSLMIGISMPFVILGREDKFKTSALVCSLPVRRSTVVLGKYVATWAAIGLGLAYAIAVTAVLPFTKFRVAEVLTGRALLVSLFLISLIFAVILPFTLRFGLTGHHHPARQHPAAGHPGARPDQRAGGRQEFAAEGRLRDRRAGPPVPPEP